MPDPWFEALGMTWTEVALTVVTATAIYVAVIAFSRLFGQRQFSVSSSYDLAFVFAMGSLIGRVVLVRTSLANALVGLLTMFLLHSAMGWLHHHSALAHRAVQNQPVLLVAYGEILPAHLRRAKTSVAEVHQQLRLHGIATLDEVDAVVLERDGNVSVLRKETRLSRDVLADVVGREQLFTDHHDGSV